MKVIPCRWTALHREAAGTDSGESLVRGRSSSEDPLHISYLTVAVRRSCCAAKKCLLNRSFNAAFTSTETVTVRDYCWFKQFLLMKAHQHTILQHFGMERQTSKLTYIYIYIYIYI